MIERLKRSKKMLENMIEAAEKDMADPDTESEDRMNLAEFVMKATCSAMEMEETIRSHGRDGEGAAPGLPGASHACPEWS